MDCPEIQFEKDLLAVLYCFFLNVSIQVFGLSGQHIESVRYALVLSQYFSRFALIIHRFSIRLTACGFPKNSCKAKVNLYQFSQKDTSLQKS